MHIYLPEIKRNNGETVSYRFSGPFPAHFEMGGAGKGGCFDVDIRAYFSDNKVFIFGSMETDFPVECARCLKPFRQRDKVDIREVFLVLNTPAESDNPVELAEKAANELTVAGDYLYLEEYLRQVFILSQHYNPLCRPDCKGLCAACGYDLNYGECDCRADAGVDIRLIKLKQLISGSPS